MAGLKVGVLGASGHIGSQLLNMLSVHPEVGTLVPFTRSQPRAASLVLPTLKHLRLPEFRDPVGFDYSTLDCVFSCLPHGESFQYFADVMRTSSTFIDMSSDYRVKCGLEYENIHHRKHPLPEVLPEFMRVVPEINGAGSTARRWLSVPGCNATAVILAIYPLYKERLIVGEPIVVDAKVSSSGSSAKLADAAQLHYNRAGGVRVHTVMGTHRHSREIEGYISEVLGMQPKILLNTYSVDMVRGILASCYCRCSPGIENRRAHALFREAYGASDSIRIIKRASGLHSYPNPKHVIGTNLCDIGFEFDHPSGRGVVIAAIDNLIKGGAGSAIQVFNLHYHLDPACAIPRLPVYC